MSVKYFLRVLIACNQLINALLGGMPDETLSSRAHRQHLKGNNVLRNLINSLFFWQQDHCFLAYQEELFRYQFKELED